MHVHFTRVAFAYSDAAPIFEDLTLDLGPGWTGLVGANGAGKSTLLALVAGDVRPQRGQLRLDPPGAKVVFCPQRVDEPTADVERLAIAAGADAARLRGRLALEPSALARWATLSPGERRRWQLGAALAAEPDVLLVDEPTNHVDAGARRHVLAALRLHRGLGIVVSHDRALLDELTVRTARVTDRRVSLVPAPYSTAREVWEAEEAALRDARDAARGRVRAAERRLSAARDERAQAARQRSRSVRGNDPDSRSIVADGRVARAEGTLGRQVEVRRGAVARAREAAAALVVPDELGGALFVGYERCPRPRVLELVTPEVRAGDRVLLRDVHVALGREDRVWLAGPNGAGKTTLLDAILAASRLPPDRLLAVPQELDAAAGRRVLAEVRALDRAARGRTLAMLAALGSDPDRVLASAQPSPGEARKLLIALGLARHVWAVVLDEPTNHLDLPSIERLEAALAGYPGALLVVSHDAPFALRVSHTRWVLQDGEVRSG